MKRTRIMTWAAMVAVASLGLAACGDDSSTNGNGGAGEGTTSEGGSGTWRLAFNQTEAHPQYLAAVSLGEKFSEATDGRYKIEVYANELLGGQAEVVENLSQGTVEMMWIGGPVLESFNEDFIVFNLPYVFTSKESHAAVMADEAVTGELFSSLVESDKIQVLGGGYAGTRNVYGTSAVRTPADLAGMKIRVQQSDSQVKMIELMGGVASPMSQGEVYTALQSGVLDGAENNETVFNALKHDEVAKFYSMTQHLMIPDYLLINSDTLANLSDADREAFLGLIPEIIDEANQGFYSYVDESRAKSEATGAEFVEDVDVAAFQKAVEPLVLESINNPVREALYEAIQASNAANS